MSCRLAQKLKLLELVQLELFAWSCSLIVPSQRLINNLERKESSTRQLGTVLFSQMLLGAWRSEGGAKEELSASRFIRNGRGL